VHGEKPLYADEWLDIRLADVELPGGRHLGLGNPAGKDRPRRRPCGCGRLPSRCVLVSRGQISSGTTLAALLYAIARQVPARSAG
jgi:hypothetical protein